MRPYIVFQAQIVFKHLRDVSTLLVFLSVSIFMQAQEVPYKQYTTHDGLIQMQIMTMMQSESGLLYLGTKKGLSVFDGTTFRNYSIEDGLVSNNVTCFLELSEDSIYVGTRSGLSLFDGKTFQTINDKIDVRQILETDSTLILTIYEDQLRHYHFDKRSNKPFDNIDYKGNILTTFRDCFLRMTSDGEKVKLFRSNKEHPLIEYDGTLYGYTWKNDRFYFLAGSLQDTTVLEIDNAKCDTIFQSSHGKVKGNIPEKLTFCNGTISICFKLDNQGRFSNQPPVFDKINKRVESQEFTWLATEEGLIQHFDNSPFLNIPKKDLPSVWSIVEDQSSEKMWFSGFRQQPRMMLDGHISIDEKLNSQSEKFPFFKSFYMGGKNDKSGNLYLPGHHGVFFKSSDSASWQLWSHLKVVLELYIDQDKEQLLVGGKNSVRIVDRFSGAVLDSLGPWNGMSVGRNTLALEKRTSHEIWIGAGNGIEKFDSNSGNFHRYHRATSGDTIRSVVDIFKDHRSNLWIASRQGVLFYNHEKDLIEDVFPEISSQGSFVTGVSDSLLLVGATEGIYAIDLRAFYQGQNRSKLYNQHNGYLGIEPAQNCAFHDSKGQIWVPSNTVTTIIDPARISFENEMPQPMFRSANDIDLGLNPAKFSLKKGVNDLRVEFTSIGFNRTSSPLYSYRLKENETQNASWSKWTKNDYAKLSDLPSGKHILELRTQDPTGKTSPSKQFLISVDLPIYKEPGFNLFAGLGFLGALFVIGFLALRSQHKALKSRHQDNMIRIMRIQSLQSQLNPHFIFNILGTLQQMILSENPQRANKYLIKMANLIRGILNASIEADPESGLAEADGISLEKEIETLDLYLEFENLHYSKAFGYDISTNPNMIASNIFIPPMLIQPFVENAIKHGLLPLETKGTLLVDFEIENGDLIVSVVDDGIGLLAAKKRDELQPNLAKDRSLGSALVYERVRILNEMGTSISIDTIDISKSKEQINFKQKGKVLAFTKGTMVKILIKNVA